MDEPLKPYLTRDEVAAELGCSTAELAAVVAAGELPMIRNGEREVISRWALEAYRRRLNGEAPVVLEGAPADDETLRASFLAAAAGRTPEQFYTAFNAGEVEDTSENMTLLVKAVSLGGDLSARNA